MNLDLRIVGVLHDREGKQIFLYRPVDIIGVEGVAEAREHAVSGFRGVDPDIVAKGVSYKNAAASNPSVSGVEVQKENAFGAKPTLRILPEVGKAEDGLLLGSRGSWGGIPPTGCPAWLSGPAKPRPENDRDQERC